MAKQLFGWGLALMVAGVLVASYFCARVGVVDGSSSLPLQAAAARSWAHCFMAMAIIGVIAWPAGAVMLLNQDAGDLGEGVSPSRREA